MNIEERVLGKTGLKVSVLGFGSAEIGFLQVPSAEVKQILNGALDDGLNLIDTASAYLDSESLIGEAISGRRSEYYLATKCGAIEGFSKSDWSKEGILRTVEQSLKKLRTDHIDILFLHSCAELEMSWGEALQGVEAARDRGYTRFIGYSGDGAPALWAIRSGRFDVLETSISIADQEALELLMPSARAANIGVIVKRPIANAAWRYTERPANDYHLEYYNRLRALKYDFIEADVDAAASIALRFTLFQPGVHCAIVGSTKPGRWRENAAALQAGPLSEELLKQITQRWNQTADRTWVGMS